MIQYLKIGWSARTWFEDCERALKDLFPDPVFAARLLAATSPRNNLRSNIKIFRRVLFEAGKYGKVSTDYLPGIYKNVCRVFMNEPLRGQKVRAFAAAMTGDVNAVVVDMWLMKAFGYPDDRPTPKQFKSIERDVREIAPYYGLTPRELSAILWHGCRLYHTGKTENRYTGLLYKEFRTLFDVDTLR